MMVMMMIIIITITTTTTTKITVCRIQYRAYIFLHKYVSVHISIWVMAYPDTSAVYTEQVSVRGLCSSLISHAKK
jgi:hypothetical protein